MMNYFSSLLFRRAIHGQDGKGQRKVGQDRPVRVDAQLFCEPLEDRTVPAGMNPSQTSIVLPTSTAVWSNRPSGAGPARPLQESCWMS